MQPINEKANGEWAELISLHSAYVNVKQSPHLAPNTRTPVVSPFHTTTTKCRGMAQRPPIASIDQS